MDRKEFEDNGGNAPDIAEGGITSEEARQAGMGQEHAQESGHETGRSAASAAKATNPGHDTNDDDISQRDGFEEKTSH